MQALHVSGQAAEIREFLPSGNPASEEVDNSEHPFRKLLASLRNAMKQGEEPGQETLERDLKSSVRNPSSRYAETVQAGSGSKNSAGLALGETGLSGEAVPGFRTGSMSLVGGSDGKPGTVQQETEVALKRRAQSVALTKGESVVKSDSGKALKTTPASEHPRKTKALSEASLDEALGQAIRHQVPAEDIQALPGHSNGKRGSSGGEILKSFDHRTPGRLETLTMATSIGPQGLQSATGLNRNQSQENQISKAKTSTLVTEADPLGRRSGRYSVVDLRLKARAERSAMASPAEAKAESNPGGNSAGELLRGGVTGLDAAGRQTTSDQSAQADLSKGSYTESGDKTPASFADNLAARLRDGGSMDIVRSAQIVLKDGDSGLIRLRLEPESLGGVKIELKMADKQISARIIVESDLAGEAFRSSLESLRDAFSSSGFETTSIEVEVRDGHSGFGHGGRGDASTDGDEPDRSQYLARKAEELGAAVPAADAAYGRSSVIDMVV